MKAPYFWSAGLDPKSREAAPLTRALLSPLAWLYVWGVSRKIRTAKPETVGVPVICVGNLTVGGVGKTPIVKALRSKLTDTGLRVASLSRGHGGREKGPLKVVPGVHLATEVGDEPCMLAASGETWIGRNRADAAKAMAADGVELIIMDDGHQNTQLAKDLTLVVIDAAAPFGNGYCLPKGPLREPVSTSLTRAEGVILMGDGPVPKHVPPDAVVRAQLAPVQAPPDGAVVAFAGIGRPTKFFDSLTQSGADVREAVGFGDHYVYTPGDMSFLRQLAADHGARLITTEKDYFRLTAAWRDGILTWPVEARFADLDRLEGWLQTLRKA